MTKTEIKVGGTYLAKVSNKLTKVRVDNIVEEERFFGKQRLVTHYHVTNLVTGRKTTFKSAAKFRKEIV